MSGYNHPEWVGMLRFRHVLKDDFESNALSILPVGKVLAVYCRSGRRSKKAAHILVKRGYKVIELDQGYNGWVESGKKVVK